MPKGWPVLIALAIVGLMLLGMLLGAAASLLFRWRMQFSLRLLLGLAVVVAIPSSWLAVEMRKARQQRKAVQALTHCGTAFYDVWTTGPHVGSKPPAWLTARLGEDMFVSVDTFVCQGDTDADLEHLH